MCGESHRRAESREGRPYRKLNGSGKDDGMTAGKMEESRIQDGFWKHVTSNLEFLDSSTVVIDVFSETGKIEREDNILLSSRRQ